MGIVVVTPPSEAEILGVLSVAELKLNMRVSHNVEDDVFKACILAAYDWLAGPEFGWLNRTLLTTTYKLTLPGFVKEETYSNRDTGGPATRLVPTSVIEIPMPPLASVQTVKYLLDGVQTTFDAADYVVTTSSLFGMVSLAYESLWPTTIDTHPEAVEIAFTAGYGNAAAVKLKYGIVQALKLLAGDAYRNREDTYAEPRLVAVNRKIINGVTRYAGRYRIENRHA